MFKHILVATDGSAFAAQTATFAIALAKANQAKLTALTVTPSWSAIGLSEIAVGHFEEEFAGRMAAQAQNCLAPIQQAAKAAGVSCEALHVTGDKPYEAINAAAHQAACDLVVVGAHGRTGVAGIMLGSETVKILTHSHVPVLVFRE